VKVKRCEIEHVILDGADYDEPCPKCGQKASDRDDAAEMEPETEDISMEPVSCCD
jgi:hypothetical protein